MNSFAQIYYVIHTLFPHLLIMPGLCCVGFWIALSSFLLCAILFFFCVSIRLSPNWFFFISCSLKIPNDKYVRIAIDDHDDDDTISSTHSEAYAQKTHNTLWLAAQVNGICQCTLDVCDRMHCAMNIKLLNGHTHTHTKSGVENLSNVLLSNAKLKPHNRFIYVCFFREQYRIYLCSFLVLVLFGNLRSFYIVHVSFFGMLLECVKSYTTHIHTLKAMNILY